MEIVSVETKHVTEQTFAGLVEIDFDPYYRTTIRFTDPREGHRAEQVYSATGKGETASASEQNAIATLRAHSDKSHDAYVAYLNSQGIHFVDC